VDVTYICRVEFSLQYPRAMRCGSSAKRTVPPRSSLLLGLAVASFLSWPSAFAGPCSPRTVGYQFMVNVPSRESQGTFWIRGGLSRLSRLVVGPDTHRGKIALVNFDHISSRENAIVSDRGPIQE
jgi:hypothetical protein